MYYPKSQIKTNLYTNGNELILSDTKQVYIGYYYITSNGKYFTGKTPESGVNVELLPFTVQQQPTTPSYSVSVNITDYNNENYNLVKSIKPSILIIPTYTPTLPTQQDYQNGEFRRYFVKKTNELIYIEVNKDTYDNILNRNPKWLWQDYLPFNLPWQITGDKLQVAKTNKNITDLTMQRLTLTKFNLYLRGDYTKFYK